MHWLAAHPDLDVPHLAESDRIDKPSPDEFFDYLVDTLIESITTRLG